MVRKPTLQPIWLVDNVAADSSSGKLTVAGFFNQVELPPGLRGYANPFFLFFTLTNVCGDTPLRLTLTDMADMEVLLTYDFEVSGEHPTEALDVALPFPGFPAPHPGEYVWDMWCDGDPIGSVRVQVFHAGEG